MARARPVLLRRRFFPRPSRCPGKAIASSSRSTSFSTRCGRPEPKFARSRAAAPGRAARSAAEKFSEQPLRVGKFSVVDLRRPEPVDVEIGGVGDMVAVLHEPVVHLLDEERIVTELPDAHSG